MSSTTEEAVLNLMYFSDVERDFGSNALIELDNDEPYAVSHLHRPYQIDVVPSCDLLSRDLGLQQ